MHRPLTPPFTIPNVNRHENFRLCLLIYHFLRGNVQRAAILHDSFVSSWKIIVGSISYKLWEVSNLIRQIVIDKHMNNIIWNDDSNDACLNHSTKILTAPFQRQQNQQTKTEGDEELEGSYITWLQQNILASKKSNQVGSDSRRVQRQTQEGLDSLLFHLCYCFCFIIIIIWW